MKRREFITLLGGAATAWPLTARAQVPNKRPIIGLLLGGSEESTRQRPMAFQRGMSDFGFNEGQNIGMHYLYAEGVLTRAPTLAAELVRLKPDVIVTNFTGGALAAKEATNVIPIVSWLLTRSCGVGVSGRATGGQAATLLASC